MVQHYLIDRCTLQNDFRYNTDDRNVYLARAARVHYKDLVVRPIPDKGFRVALRT